MSDAAAFQRKRLTVPTVDVRHSPLDVLLNENRHHHVVS
jgi:hypothetical protein